MRITPEIILFPGFFPGKIAVADFLAVIEAVAADYAVGNACAHEIVFVGV